jgi:hypothetical protein
MGGMKTRGPSSVAKEFNDATKALLAEFNDKLSAMEMLAVTAHLVGVLIALQDQRKMTREMALELVGQNIEAGNAEAMKSVMTTEGNA